MPIGSRGRAGSGSDPNGAPAPGKTGSPAPTAEREGEEWARRSDVRFLQCEHDLEDGQYRPRIHVVRGDGEPVPAVLDGDLRLVGPTLLRVDGEVACGDLCPVEGQPVRVGR